MKKHNAASGLLALLLFAALGMGLPKALPALSPDEYDGTLNIAPYKTRLTRPISAFDHETHMELAGDCTYCHHGRTDDGKRIREDYDPSESCDTCHTPGGGKGVTPLKRAYHQNCIGCHRNVNRGPTHCAGCHISYSISSLRLSLDGEESPRELPGFASHSQSISPLYIASITQCSKNIGTGGSRQARLDV